MIGRTLNRRYKITELLGKGAMGTVYRAIDSFTRQNVALKIITSELAIDPDMLERFKREGEALQQLNHPNVVRFVDAFRWAGANSSDNPISAGLRGIFSRPADPTQPKKKIVADEYYVIVMEYIHGGSLFELLEKGPLSLERARQIGLDLCDALTRAHRLNIVHRDIKPENILLADDGTPKLADFGVARITAGTRMTRTGTQVGTPYYMAPEAWEGKLLDAQADIWSFGVVLYEMLSGQVPFDGDTGPVVMTKVMTGEPPDLKSLRVDVPPEMVKIISRMLTRGKDLRYQSVREVAVDLERVHLAAPPKLTEENRDFAGKATRIIPETEDTEKAAREKAEKEAAEKARLEAEERAKQLAAREQAERERKAADDMAREKLKREAAEKIEREKADKAAREKLAEEAAQKAKREKADREAAERTVREKEKRALAEQTKLFLKPVGILGLIIAIFLGGSLVLPGLFSLLPIAEPSVTMAALVSLVPPTRTLAPSATSTLRPTSTSTLTPTLIPESSILFQRTFEDGAIGASSRAGSWAIEDEPDGNHCLLGSGEAYIWYQRKQTRTADFALEIRVKFIKGQALYILFPDDPNASEHYGVAINSAGLSILRTWSGTGINYPLLADPDKWYTLRVEIKGDGDSLGVYIDNLLFGEHTLQPHVINRDIIGFVVNENEEDQICFDDMRVWDFDSTG